MAGAFGLGVRAFTPHRPQPCQQRPRYHLPLAICPAGVLPRISLRSCGGGPLGGASLPGPEVSCPAGLPLNRDGTSGTSGSPRVQFVMPFEPEPPHSWASVLTPARHKAASSPQASNFTGSLLPFFNNGSFSAVAVGAPVVAIHIHAGATAACPVDASRAAVDIVEGMTPVGRYDFSRAIPVSNCSK